MSVTDKVVDIFREYLFRDLTKNDNFINENIFGENIALLPAEAYFLLVQLEKEFGIKFDNHVITEYRFKTVGNIVAEIQNCLDGK